VRNRSVISAVVGTALLLVGFVTPAAAQEKGASIGAGISFLSVPDRTGVGFTVDVAKEFAVMGKAAIAGVGDFSFHSFGEDTANLEPGFSETTFGGGIRVIGKAQKAQFFGQVVFGAMAERISDCTDCNSTNFMIMPGFGVNFAATPKIMIRGQVDFPQVKFDEEWDNATRFWFGVVFGFGK
jgi:hypothetical protein